MSTARKSRSGCETCRKKRVKCDEKKPSCSRCSARLRNCEYVVNFRWQDNSTTRRVEKKTGAKKARQASEVYKESCDKPNTQAGKNLTNEHLSSAVRSDSAFSAPHQWQELLSINLDSFQYDDMNSSSDPKLATLATFDVHDGQLVANLEGSLSSDMQSFESLLRMSSSVESNVDHAAPVALTSCEPEMQLDFDLEFENIERCLDLPASQSDNAIQVVSQYQPFDCAVSIPTFRPPRIPTNDPTDNTTTLMEYYFRRIAPMFCCYEDLQNPFETNVGTLWACNNTGSLAIAAQSMAMACLAELSPQLHPSALKLRRKAMMQLRFETQSSKLSTSSIYATVLLGASAGWFSPKESMSAMFQQCRNMLDAIYDARITASDKAHADFNKDQTAFFSGILVYWEMYLSFMLPTSPAPVQQVIQAGASPSKTDDKEPLHPWTGVSSELFTISATVGTLIRRVRERLFKDPLNASMPDSDSISDMHEAHTLESKLLNLRFQFTHADTEPLPLGSDKWLEVLKHLAESYRTTALMQLYRVFDCLDIENINQLDFSGTQLTSSHASRQQKLCDIATVAVEYLMAIPSGSNTLRFALIPLIAAAGQLVIPDRSSCSWQARDLRIAQLRLLVHKRLVSMHELFPGNRMQKVLDLLKEVWRRTDSQGQEARSFWLDVAIENNSSIF